jgi:hypothetical protein
MELIRKVRTVELTEQQAVIIDQLCEGAWKTGGVRSPADGKLLEDLRAMIRETFMVKAKEKEAI